MVEMSTLYQVTAKRWRRGWELHIDGVGVTQSRTLLDAEEMVRDYIALDLDVQPDSFDVTITPEIGAGIDGELLDLQALDRKADEAQQRATMKRRHVVLRLRDEGLSGREIALLLNISAQRVSQLLASARDLVRRGSKTHV
jgi:DNA-directed RNA polymerase specialized sigma24 family protein